MMEKNKFILPIIIMLVSFLLINIGTVLAEGEAACSNAELGKLREEASKIRATYVPGEVSAGKAQMDMGDEKETFEQVLDLKLYNVSENFVFKYDYSGKNVKPNSFYRTYGDYNPEDKSITVRQKALNAIISYTITVYPASGACSGQVLRTIRITLPKYNVYSNLEMCQGIQDYYLCSPYVTTDFDSSTFYDKVDSYKAKMLENKETEEKDNNSLISNALSGVKKHKYLVVGLIVAIGVVVTVIILKRKKSEA